MRGPARQLIVEPAAAHARTAYKTVLKRGTISEGSVEMTASGVRPSQVEQALGPVSYLIVEFPGSKMTGEGLPILVDLVDRGLIRILDLQFVMRDTDGSIAAVEV